MELNERIEYLRSLTGLNKKAFARELGISDMAYQKYTRQSLPGFEVVRNIFRVFPGLNPEWFFEGSGPTFVIYIRPSESINEPNSTLSSGNS